MNLSDIQKRFSRKDDYTFYKDAIKDVWKATEQILDTNFFLQYTDHSINHSKRVLGYVFHIIDEVGTRNSGWDPLSNDELLVLVCATLLHDVGMATEAYLDFSCVNNHSVSCGKYDNQRCLNDGDSSCTKLSKLEQMRVKHHESAYNAIVDSVRADVSNALNLGLECIAQKDMHLIEDIATIAKSHRIKDITDFESIVDRGMGKELIRKKLLSALLCVGDAMDITHKRVVWKKLRQYDIPIESVYHWIRCYFVSQIAIEESTIKISFGFPTDYLNENSDCFDLPEKIIHNIKKELDNQIEAVYDILIQNGIFLYGGLNGYVKEKSRASVAGISRELCRVNGTKYDIEKYIRETLPLKLSAFAMDNTNSRDESVDEHTSPYSSASEYHEPNMQPLENQQLFQNPSNTFTEVSQSEISIISPRQQPYVVWALMDFAHHLKNVGNEANYKKAIAVYQLLLDSYTKASPEKLRQQLAKNLVRFDILYPSLVGTLVKTDDSFLYDKLHEEAAKQKHFLWCDIIKLIRIQENLNIFSFINDDDITEEQLVDLFRFARNYLWLMNEPWLNNLTKDIPDIPDFHDREIINKLIAKCHTCAESNSYNLSVRAINLLISITRFIRLDHIEVNVNVLKPQHMVILFNATSQEGISIVQNLRYFPILEEFVKCFVDILLSAETIMLLKSNFASNVDVFGRLGYFWAGMFAKIWTEEEMLLASRDFLNDDCLRLNLRNEFIEKMLNYSTFAHRNL